MPNKTEVPNSLTSLIVTSLIVDVRHPHMGPHHDQICDIEHLWFLPFLCNELLSLNVKTEEKKL